MLSHSGTLALVSAAGFLASGYFQQMHTRSVEPCGEFIPPCLTFSPPVTLRLSIIAATGTFASIPPLTRWLSSNLHSTATAGLAIALNISFSIPGQILGVWIYTAKEAPRGYPTGHYTCFSMLLFRTGVLWLCSLLHSPNNKFLSGSVPAEETRLFTY